MIVVPCLQGQASVIRYCEQSGTLIRAGGEGYELPEGNKVDEKNDVFAVGNILVPVFAGCLLTHRLMSAR